MSFGRAILAAVVVLAPCASSAQTARLLPADDPANAWITRLQERGYLATLHPTAIPHAWDEVTRAVESETAIDDPAARRWLDLLSRRLGRTPGRHEGHVTVEIRPGLDVTSNGRLDPLRILDSERNVFTRGSLTVDGSRDGFTVSAGLHHDLYYDSDPDGQDAVLRLYMRSSHSYAGYRGGSVMVHVGRFDTHWGRPSEPALLVSSNPRSMDALHLRLGGHRFALRSLFAELDGITGDGRFTGTAGADTVASGIRRRYLAAHRIDWRPTPSLALTIAESAVISGTGTGFSLKYLNPVQPFFLAVDNRPKNDENNGLLAAMVWWRLQAVTVTAQFLADDFVYMSGNEPASLAGSLSVIRAAARSWLDLGFRITAVTARTYNTHQPAGRYMHMGRGIGTAFSDFVEASVFARAMLHEHVEGLELVPALTWLSQGEQDYRKPQPGNDEAGTILTGTVERTVRASVRANYEMGALGLIWIDAGLNRQVNAGHESGQDRTRFVATAGVSLRLSIAGSADLGD